MTKKIGQRDIISQNNNSNKANRLAKIPNQISQSP